MSRQSLAEISWCVELTVLPAQLNAFRQLTSEMVEAAKYEEGTLIFERFIDADESIVHVYERYVDADAAVLHLLEFRKRFAARFAPLVDRTWFMLYGTPNAELRNLLEEMLVPTQLQTMARLDGFGIASQLGSPGE